MGDEKGEVLCGMPSSASETSSEDVDAGEL
jgi:hypothetical protein